MNLRPADLLKAGRVQDVEGYFLACWGPVGQWLEASLKELCLEDPAKIEEALICFIPGPRGSPPDIAAVVHLKEDAKKSDLLERFGGERRDDLPKVYYLSQEKEKAYILKDLRTYAIAPAKLAAEMVQAADAPNPTDSGIEALLARTDRDRMFTVVLTPSDIKLHGQFLAPANAQDFLQNVGDWLSNDDEVEAAAWSFHLEREFYSELLLRNSHIVKPFQVQRSIQLKLEKTPERLLAAIRQMNPADFGKRRVIGRVPAMSKAFALASRATADNKNRFASLVTELPERAGSNLALGTLLAWDESTRTEFHKGTPGAKEPSGGSKVPELIADRLKTKIDVDFRREPLFSAFDYIAGEAKFNVMVDGDALKMEGYTKNMTQDFKLEAAPAGKAIQEILKKYDKMTIVVDEQKKLVTVMTKKAAEARGLKPFEFAP